VSIFFHLNLNLFYENKYAILNINVIRFYDVAMISYFVYFQLLSQDWSDNNFETPSSNFSQAWLIRELGYCSNIVYCHYGEIHSSFYCSYLRLSTHEYIFGIFHYWTIYYTTDLFLGFFSFLFSYSFSIPWLKQRCLTEDYELRLAVYPGCLSKNESSADWLIGF